MKAAEATRSRILQDPRTLARRARWLTVLLNAGESRLIPDLLDGRFDPDAHETLMEAANV